MIWHRSRLIDSISGFTTGFNRSGILSIFTVAPAKIANVLNNANLKKKMLIIQRASGLRL